VFLSDGSSKIQQKTFHKKNRVEKFYKKFDKNPKPIFRFFYHVFGRFSVRGVQKHHKKYQTNKSNPDPFLASDPPTHHGGHRFLFLPAP
jgi:hypothetical protein